MTNRELVEALDRLDALFSDESKWTKRESARNVFGNPVSELDVAAICWCLEGGIRKVGDAAIFYSLTDQLIKTAKCRGALWVWNDHPRVTFQRVKRLIAATRKRLSE